MRALTGPQVVWKRKEADSCHLASPFADQLMDTGSHSRVEGHFRRDRLKILAWLLLMVMLLRSFNKY